MLHVDLGCGLGGWQDPFRESPRWRSVGLDIRHDVRPDVQADIRRLPLECSPTLLTMSPPCTEFARWMLPWLDEPAPDMTLVEACLDAVDELDPDWWVLENSRGLHQFWRPAATHYGAFYLWGEFPAFDVRADWQSKESRSGRDADERAKIPSGLADGLRRAVEWQTGRSARRAIADGSGYSPNADRGGDDAG